MKNRKPLPSQETIRSIVDYDPSTGLFIWKDRENLRPPTKARIVGKNAGFKNRYGYVVIRITGDEYYAHRIAYVYVHGDVLTKEIDVDHVNGRKDDNRIQNLRPATRSQNIANGYKRKRKYDLPKGVNREGNKFKACIRAMNKRYFIGNFDTVEEARDAYLRAAQFHFGKFARAA